MNRFAGIVRAATPEDVPAITDIYNQAVHDRIATCDLSDVPTENRRAWLERHRTPYGVWVADEGEQVQGWVLIAPYDAKPCFHQTASFSTYVRRETRGRGIGSALRAYMIEEARRQGLHALVNRVWSTNQASITLAKRFGFRQVGYLPEIVHIDGNYVDCLLFELILDGPAPAQSVVDIQIRAHEPCVFWLTGQSAAALVKQALRDQGWRTLLIDGDALGNVQRAADAAALLAAPGLIVLVAASSRAGTDTGAVLSGEFREVTTSDVTAVVDQLTGRLVRPPAPRP